MQRHVSASPRQLEPYELNFRTGPLLLGCETHATVTSEKWQNLPTHRDEEQVQKDVDRAFVYYPSSELPSALWQPNLIEIDESQKSIAERKSALSELILHVLRTNPMLHYFQGYHDIAQVFLLVLGGSKPAFSVMSRVSLLRIRDYMLASLSPATKHLQLIPYILQSADAELAAHLGETPPYFALSAVLTLYAHDMQDYGDIVRLYDFVLAHEPVMTIYLFAALIIHRREELLDIPRDEPDMLLFKLSKLPQPLDLQALIDRCLQLFGSSPPEQLPGKAWQNISRHSVLKTSRDICSPQSLEHARALFAKQSQQLVREQQFAKIMKQVQRNRRPIVSFGVTLLVGVLSYYLRKTGNDRILWTLIWRTAETFCR